MIGSSSIMQNQAAVEAMYSATFVEHYMDTVENLPNDIQQHLSQLREFDLQQYQGFLSEIDDLMKMYDEATTPSSQRSVLAKIQKGLILCQDIGDFKLATVEKIADLIEERGQLLEHDAKNLDFNNDASSTTTVSHSHSSSGRIRNNGSSRLNAANNQNRGESSTHDISNSQNNIAGGHQLDSDFECGIDSETMTATPKHGGGGNSRSGKKSNGTPGPMGGHKSTSSTPITNNSTNKRRQQGVDYTNNNNSSSSTPAAVGGPKQRVFGGGSKDSSITSSTDKRIKKRKRQSIDCKTSSRSIANKGLDDTSDGETGDDGGGGGSTANNRSTSRATPQRSAKLDLSHIDIDPDEPTYCICDQVSYGDMIGCDNDLCPIEWFHFNCVQLSTKPKGKWFCPKCRSGEKATVMRPKAQFLKELERYNKEREEKIIHQQRYSKRH